MNTGIGSEFDDFLYAQIAEESNGMLSMLSALARRNVDPWDEAARLARLPREAATRFVTNLISDLPEGPTKRVDPGPVAERLIALLPQRLATTLHAPNPSRDAALANIRQSIPGYLLLYIVLALFFLGGNWLAWHARAPVRSGADAAAQNSAAASHDSAPTSAPAAAAATRN
jgi:hypothetical protein